MRVWCVCVKCGWGEKARVFFFKDGNGYIPGRPAAMQPNILSSRAF